jgi:hypothetical protein
MKRVLIFGLIFLGTGIAHADLRSQCQNMWRDALQMDTIINIPGVKGFVSTVFTQLKNPRINDLVSFCKTANGNIVIEASFYSRYSAPGCPGYSCHTDVCDTSFLVPPNLSRIIDYDKDQARRPKLNCVDANDNHYSAVQTNMLTDNYDSLGSTGHGISCPSGTYACKADLTWTCCAYPQQNQCGPGQSPCNVNGAIRCCSVR